MSGPALPPGTRLGPYEVRSFLGAGGMGEVYRARDTRLGRDVALKVLPPSLLSDETRVGRFAHEARAAGALSHPNLLSVHDVGTEEGRPYLVCELLEGETLRDRLQHGDITPRKAVGYAVQIAHGLAAAHEKGIVHRDLKPENLFLTRDGHIKILDFGLAKLTHPDVVGGLASEAPTKTAGTEPGVVMGTPGYMSPEQVRGERADQRSDIFAFGAILYEMLTGRRAFKRETAAETMAAILNEEPPPLRESGKPIPPEVVRVVDHCLEKSPQERFQSARDLAFDLNALGGEPVAPAPRPRVRPAFVWGGSALALIAVAGGTLLWQRGRGTGTPRSQAPGSHRKSIAVLPFQNLSPDPANAFFADGVTEDILTHLAKIRDLKVISRTSVMRYRGTQKPVREIAEELGVATVLEGSVRRAGNRVRITGQLVDARTDEHLWAETYDRDLEDIFAIQSDVAQQIATALQATLSPAERTRIEERPTESLSAYNHYLEGRERYYCRRKADNEKAIEHFQKALELDPRFALAYAGLGDAYALRAVRFGFPRSWLESSLEVSRKAVALNPGLPDGYKALGQSYLSKGSYREALEANRRAVELGPNHFPSVHTLALTLFFLGRQDEALPFIRRESELAPTDAAASGLRGVVEDVLGETERAEASFRRAVELQPDVGRVATSLIHFYLRHGRDREALEQAHEALRLAPSDLSVMAAAGEAEFIGGDPEQARRLFAQVLPSWRGVRLAALSQAGVETYLAALSLRSGRRGEAERLLAESLSANRRNLENGNQDFVVPFDMACVHALRGEKDEAFRWLEKAIEAGWRGSPLGTRSPLLDPLRGDERFVRVEARLAALVAEMRRRAGLS